MDFYYPNRTNDFWKICALIFLGDKNALNSADGKGFDLQKIKTLMTDKRIALNDTVRKARRLKGNASDKFLEVVEPVPLFDLLAEMPECKAVASTGEKAAGILAELTATEPPKMGEMVKTTIMKPGSHLHGKPLEIWRMPSTSRAYPMPLEKKADFYAHLFHHLQLK